MRPSKPARYSVLPFLLLVLIRPATLHSQTPSPDTLTLAEVVGRVLENHPAIQGAGEEIAAARARVGQRHSAFYPELDFNGHYSRVGPVPSIDLPGQGSFELYPSNNYNVNFELRHTLLDFGKRSTNERLARSGEEAAGDDLELLTSRLAFQAVDDFYTILYLQGGLRVQDDEIAALNQHLAVTRELARTGSATEFEVLTTQVRVANASSRRIDIANALERAIIDLRGLMGSPPDEPVELRGGFETDLAELDVDSLTSLALAQRPELALARDGVESAELRRHLAALDRRPSLDLGLGVGAKNGYVPNLNEVKGNFVAALSLELPVFNGFRTRNELEETEAELGAARARTLDVSRRVVTEVRKAAADVRASQAKLEAAELQVRQAEEAVALARVRYRAGVITNLDVLDAETSLAEAKLVELEARYHLVTTKYALQRAVGDQIW